MRYHVVLDGEEVTLELLERDGRTYAVHEGVELEVELARVRESSYSLLLGARSLPVVASGPNDDLVLQLASETWHASVTDEREALLAEALGAKAGRRGGGTLRSVMPGIVREVRVAAGDAVVKGQPLLILEAMKMQNEIRADADGTVSAVHVAAGTAVAKDDALVTIEAAG